MSFGRLLAAGKSLVNGNVAGRYQMQRGMALPQFISPKNPFKQEAVAKPVAPPPVVAAPATNLSASASAPESTSARLPVGKLSAARSVSLVQRAKNAGTILGAKLRGGVKLRGSAKWLGGAMQRAMLFCLDHNPFSAIGRPKLMGIPRFGKAAEQGELSLDRVKVVRNDLTHADLEVVQVGGGQK